MKAEVKKELSQRHTLLSKLKYIFFAYKFELIVAVIAIGFVAFFAQSIFIHDNAVLNVAIYTQDKKQPNSLNVSSTQEELNKALKINYSHHRDTVEVSAGSTNKVSDQAKLSSMLKAGQVDALVTSKSNFDMLKKKKKNLNAIPNKLATKIDKKNVYSYKGRILGISANKLAIFKTVAKSDNNIFCLPANGVNKAETNKLIDYLTNN